MKYQSRNRQRIGCWVGNQNENLADFKIGQARFLLLFSLWLVGVERDLSKGGLRSSVNGENGR